MKGEKNKSSIDILNQLDEVKKKESLSIKKAAEKLNIKYDRAKYLYSLLSLEEEVISGIHLNFITASHGKQLLKIKDRKTQIKTYIITICCRFSSRELSKYIKLNLDT